MSSIFGKAEKAAEAGAELGEDSFRKDIHDGGVFFFFLAFLWLPPQRKKYGSIYEHCGYTGSHV